MNTLIQPVSLVGSMISLIYASVGIYYSADDRKGFPSLSYRLTAASS
ncbi:MAG: hypothetical protein IPM83_03720 [Ignavibacteria bacterium]|nr:hypothetical protein [Ignavibacteria bacterium]